MSMYNTNDNRHSAYISFHYVYTNNLLVTLFKIYYFTSLNYESLFVAFTCGDRHQKPSRNMYFVVCAFLAIITVGNCEEKRSIGDDVLNVLDLSQCEYQIQADRCVDDNSDDRVLPDQILNSRSKASPVYEEPELQWGNYNHWLANFICKCATKLMNMKKTDTAYIGIQYFAECWANLNENVTHYKVKQLLKKSDCVDGDFNAYNSDRLNCQVYSGTEFSNFFYKVSKMPNKENDCPYFTKTGCFQDTVPRDKPEGKPLPVYVMNERDPSLPNWNNHLTDWKNWGNGYLNEMLCRCAKKAKEMNKRFFGIQFYGECWAGDDEEQIDEHGLSDTCVDEEYLPTCSRPTPGQCHAKPCAGQAFTDMIYELHQGPLGCLGNPCAVSETCIPNGVSNYECV